MIVTSTRRVESAQDIPLAVSVVSSRQAEDRSIKNTAGLATLIPVLNFRTGASNKDTSLFVRGVGTISTSPGVEPSVSTVIDGVVLARPGQATLDLYDIERVEVLRGPQGTLFGKNASAGVLNISTLNPDSEAISYLDLAYLGAGNERRIKAGTSQPLSDSLALSLNALYADYDGNATNLFDGSKVNGYEKRGIRGKLAWSPVDKVKLIFAADTIVSDDTIPNGVVTATSTIAYPTGVVSSFPTFAAAIAPVVATAENRQINTNFPTHVEDLNQGLSLQADLQLGTYTLTSITAYRIWENDQYQDGDRTALATNAVTQSHDIGNLELDQFSQELRLASDKSKRFDYLTGLYYFKTNNDERYRRDIIQVDTLGTPTTNFGVADYSITATSTSAFCEGTFKITPRLRALLGARLTHEKLSYTHARTSSSTAALPGIRTAFSSSSQTDDDGLSGRAGLQFDLTPGVTTYLTYSKGYKGPAYNVFFNMQAIDTISVAAEESDSLELGLKSTFLEKRVRLNLALFQTDYTGYQANFADSVNGAPVSRLINAGDVQTKGAELDLTARVTRDLTLTTSIAYNRARIEKFNLPSGLTPAQIAAANIDGKPLPFSSDLRLWSNATYRFKVGTKHYMSLSTDYRWTDDTQYDLGQFADTQQPAYGIWDAGLTFSDHNERWRTTLLVKNIADKSYAAYLARGGQFVNRWVPRDDTRFIGIQTRYQF